jgi:hypothetical protein
MYLGGKALRAGILGDFMVSREHRAFGAGLALPKHVVLRRTSLGFDFLYGVPNAKSRRPIANAGLNSEITMSALTKPVTLAPYVSRYLSAWLAAALTPILDKGLAAVSRESYSSRATVVAEETAIDSRFDTLWARVRNGCARLIGERSSAFLRWKHSQNPNGALRAVGLHRPDEELAGYAFFKVDQAHLTIEDMLVEGAEGVGPIVRELGRIARVASCRSIWLSILADPPLRQQLSRCLFMDTGDDTRVLHEPVAESVSAWYLSNGDRNL